MSTKYKRFSELSRTIGEYAQYWLGCLRIGARTWIRSREAIRAFEPRWTVVVLRLYVVPAAVLCGALGIVLGTVHLGNRLWAGRQEAPSGPVVYLEDEIGGRPVRTTTGGGKVHQAILAAAVGRGDDASLSPARRSGGPSGPDSAFTATPGLGRDELEYAIVVDKTALRLHLYACKPGRWVKTLDLPVGVGANGGDKVTEGDKRTPEGTYYIIGRKLWDPPAELYGSLAYVLNYPNANDRLAMKDGYGVWIHGRGPGLEPGVTRGCVALSNADVLQLAETLGAGMGVPVVIVPDAKGEALDGFLDYDSLSTGRLAALRRHRQAQHELERVVGAWAEAWKSMNMDRYQRFYDHHRFSSAGMDWPQWSERKAKTFEKYDRISVSVTDLLVTEHTDSSAVVEFRQEYRSDLVASVDIKALTFAYVDTTWKIVGELSLRSIPTDRAKR